MEKKIKDIRKPEFMKEAMKSRSHNAVLEILIALAVFLIGDMVIGVIQTPAMIVHMFSSKEYIDMIRSNSFDMQIIMNLLLNLPDWIMIVSLVSEIGLIVIFILYCRFFEKRKANTMGFHKKGFLSEYARGIGIGIVAFVAAYLICLAVGSLKFHPSSSEGFTVLYLIGFLIGYLIQGMAEEVICRGYLFVSLTKRYSVSISIIISSAFFTILHGMNTGMSFLSYINLFLFGIFMALLFVRYENIWVVGAFHGIWNFVQGNIFGVQVSGLKLQRSLFTSTFVENRELINGGSFGLEGGFAVTVILGVFIAWLLRDMSRKGYIVEAESVVNPYNQDTGYSQDMVNKQYTNQPQKGEASDQDRNFQQKMANNQSTAQAKQNVQTKTYENMGLNPEETPWHPYSGAAQPPDKKDSKKEQTSFDQSYFKD